MMIPQPPSPSRQLENLKLEGFERRNSAGVLYFDAHESSWEPLGVGGIMIAMKFGEFVILRLCHVCTFRFSESRRRVTGRLALRLSGWRQPGRSDSARRSQAGRRPGGTVTVTVTQDLPVACHWQ